jgi:16S rRNA (uracil1498-N3)-methyltransferase
MKGKRYFFNGTLEKNKIVTLDGEEFHHLSSVMRTKTQERVCLFNGDGYFYFGEVKKIEKKYAEIFVDKVELSQNEPTVNLTVYQALAKGDKLSLIMQKISEIGASKLCLFTSEFADVKPTTNKGERLENIAISASKQCGRATITTTDGIFSIDEVASQIKNFDKFYVTYENEDGKTLAKDLIDNPNLKNVAVMVGCEGGFSTKEIETLKRNGAEIVSLGKRILRTETASIVSCAIVMQLLEK